MIRYFECSLTFYEERASKQTKRVYLVDALTFTEAEANMTKYMTEWEDIQDFTIKSMKRIKYDDLVYREEFEDDYKWYECKVKVKLDGDREASYKYIVADIGARDCVSQMNHYLLDTEGKYEVYAVQEKEVHDLVLIKVCCEECETCDSNVRIVNFEEQREIDQRTLKFSVMEEDDAKMMKILGAISMTKNKYKIEVNDESLEKAIGKRLGRQVKRTWKEDFVEEDGGEVVQVERNEVVLSLGDEITAENVGLIKEAAVDYITLYKE